jgi:hypothetical protein
MKVIRSSEMLGTTYKTTWTHNPEDYDPHFSLRGNLESQLIGFTFMDSKSIQLCPV